MSITKKQHLEAALENKSVEQKFLALFEGDKRKLERYKSSVMSAAMDPALKNVTAGSILKAAFDIAELGLPISRSLGLAYFVPMKGQAVAFVGYKGWKYMLREYAGILLKERPVYNCDEFSIEYLDFEDRYRLVPNLQERKEGNEKWVKEHINGIWVAVKYTTPSDEVSNYFVDVSKLEQLASVSPAMRARKGLSPYETGWILEMYMAKADGYIARKLGISHEKIDKLFEIDNKLSGLAISAVEPQEQRDAILDADVDEIEEGVGDGESSSDIE